MAEARPTAWWNWTLSPTNSPEPGSRVNLESVQGSVRITLGRKLSESIANAGSGLPLDLRGTAFYISDLVNCSQFLI